MKTHPSASSIITILCLPGLSMTFFRANIFDIPEAISRAKLDIVKRAVCLKAERVQ